MRRASWTTLGLAVLVGFAVAIPAARVVADLAHADPARLAPGWVALGRTLRVTITIGALATLLALPAGWIGRSLRGAWLLLLVAPLALPPYLAYAGLGLVRAPGTRLGDLLMSAASEGGIVWPAVASAVQAYLGLALWSWPIAAITMAIGFRRATPEVLDAARLEPMGAARRGAFVLRLGAPGIAASVMAVALVMAGSAVPLHVAQIETFAIELWRVLAETPPGRSGDAYASAWPLLAIAIVVAVAAGMALRRPVAGEAASIEGRRPLRGRALFVPLVAIVVALASAVPLALLMSGLGLSSPGRIGLFARLYSRAIEHSVMVAATVACLAAMILVGVRLALGGGRWSRRGAIACVAALVASGLAPGVLVGRAHAAAWTWGPVAWVGDSGLALILAHAARFGFVAALAGWWLHRAEPRDLAGARAIDGAVRPLAALRATPDAPAILPIAMGVGVLSLSEIEASVMLTPPGVDSLPRVVLEQLHFSRMDDLSASVVTVAGIALGAGLVAALAARLLRWWSARG